MIADPNNLAVVSRLRPAVIKKESLLISIPRFRVHYWVAMRFGRCKEILVSGSSPESAVSLPACQYRFKFKSQIWICMTILYWIEKTDGVLKSNTNSICWFASMWSLFLQRVRSGELVRMCTTYQSKTFEVRCSQNVQLSEQGQCASVKLDHQSSLLSSWWGISAHQTTSRNRKSTKFWRWCKVSFIECCIDAWF